MLGRSSGNHDWLLANLAFLAVFVYATQAIAFEWKPGISQSINHVYIREKTSLITQLSKLGKNII